ncbi:MaoC family dehydratase [Rhodopirellula sallentina]|uniref:MaoC-related acyl dehydratase n=1 Tax=Rhodopirellula sallentina SM41 TaxID=1263870 RepID=M5U2H9_9BACT|nr:MaoC/PaaZ C-terminal domain-containing protein [Rhodopirellula sallentina]EMI52061.1 MaoC-related acyl dehydratase [Rhodopirellula sallentina SM41]
MATVTFTSDASKNGCSAQAETRTSPLYFEDLEPGQSWTSPSRPISLEDVRSFSELTGDFDPLHSGDDSEESEAMALSSPFGRPVAHGLLGLSVLAGLSTEYPRAATLALVGVTDWQFENPIFFGEIVHVVTEVETVAPHGRRAGRITWLRKLISSDGRLLQQGRFITLVASKRRKPASQSNDGKHVPPRQPR